MNELKDYSGKFDPTLDFQNFSKETMQRLLKEYQTLLIALDGFYQTTITKRHNIGETMTCAVAAWKMYAQLEIKRIAGILNVKGNDVETFFKVQQFVAASPRDVFVRNYELKNKNLGIMTFVRCKNLDWMEQHAPERIIPVCHQLEKPALENYAHVINPKIKLTALKVPPRKSPAEIACVWEFKLED